MNKKFIPFIAMGGVVVIGLGVGIGFIIANANRKSDTKEIEKVQGTWVVYAYDTDPANWEKPLPYLENQFMSFDENHLTYYVNGNVAYTADVELDELYLRPTATGNSKEDTLPKMLRYRRHSEYNFDLEDEEGGHRVWRFIKHFGSYTDTATYSDNNIKGEWEVKYRNHNEDGRKFVLDDVEKRITIAPGTDKEQTVSYAWKEGVTNTLEAMGGDVHLFMPADDSLFLVEERPSGAIWELGRGN